MRSKPLFVTGPTPRTAAAVVLVAVACAEKVPAQAPPADPPPAGESAAPSGDAEPSPGRLDPLPPAAILLERVVRGFLENPPGGATLDDVMRRAAARNRAAAEAAEADQRRKFIDQQAQQLAQLLRPLRTVELAIVRRSCPSLAPEARGAVLAAAEQAVREVADQTARLQFEGDGERAGRFDVRRAIHERVAAALRPCAAPDEFAAYEHESRSRRERREEAARMRIVSKLDERLGLTAAQRRAVLDDLRIHWRPEWIRELEDHGIVSNDEPLAPDFADASIAPHLDPLQARQWRQWCDRASAADLPVNAIDWSEFNALQQGQPKLDAWWRP